MTTVDPALTDLEMLSDALRLDSDGGMSTVVDGPLAKLLITRPDLLPAELQRVAGGGESLWSQRFLNALPPVFIEHIEAAVHVLPFMSNSDVQVRRAAVSAVRNSVASPAVRDALVEALKDTDSNMRVNAASALAPVARSDDAVWRALMPLARDPDSGVRRAVIGARFGADYTAPVGGQPAGAAPRPETVETRRFGEAVSIMLDEVEYLLSREDVSDIERAFLVVFRDDVRMVDDLISRLEPRSEVERAIGRLENVRVSFESLIEPGAEAANLLVKLAGVIEAARVISGTLSL